MRDKILYSSAIIPNELYVERDADRKLRDVIERMSKPAYISVARQMGKTNLLIHTKRDLEDENNRYVYIDITSDFKTSQDCFRYIINQILNSNEDLKEFQLAKEKILEQRINSKINASEEYQNEIREILKYYKGNLIIFLDEVDDLRKHSFSDDIFGQIRKTYFIRETYSSLKRIAYILSGVIDPEKLIKTKENSPFNIAIPIYLEDFNKTEFYQLISKSELELDTNIKDYIFDWLSGNPRMSFEILSLVEDKFLQGIEVTNHIVDKIINDFYLTNFKNPPIDHIRDVVSNNSDVRKALIKLKRNQLEELSDEDINKFYLFGITSSKVNKQSLKIKNKVLELSLNDEWLNKIELQKKGYYEIGNEKIKQGEIFEGIRYLEEYIQNEPTGSFVNLAKYDIGKTYNDIGKHELSNEYLLKKPINIDTSTEVYFWQVFYIGINFSKLNQFDEAFVYFDEIIDNCKIPQIVINAYVNKGELLINQEAKHEFRFILDFYNLVLKYIETNNEKIVEKNTLLTVIYYRIGYLNHNEDKKEIAITYFEEAKKFSKKEQQPVILLYIDSCLEGNEEKRVEIYQELSDLIIENKLKFNIVENIAMPFVEYHLLVILTNLYDFQLIDDFNKLINYSLSNIYENEIQEYEILFKVAILALRSKDYNVCEELMNKILTYSDINLEVEMIANQMSGLLENDLENAIVYFNRYLEIFNEKQNFNHEINENDLNSFINIIRHYRNKKEYFKALEIALIAESYFKENMSIFSNTFSLTILFFILDSYAVLENHKSAQIYGEKILLAISKLKPNYSELREDDVSGLNHIENQTKQFLQNLYSSKIRTSKIVNSKEPGRNEVVRVQYNDGKQIKTKYKKVILDLKNGKCILI